jgi:hypothetical protein
MHKQVLCIAAVLPGTPGGSSDLAEATATLKERDAGERGQAVHQLVLESWVTSLCCGRLSLPVVPVEARDNSSVGGVRAPIVFTSTSGPPPRRRSGRGGCWSWPDRSCRPSGDGCPRAARPVRGAVDRDHREPGSCEQCRRGTAKLARTDHHRHALARAAQRSHYDLPAFDL